MSFAFDRWMAERRRAVEEALGGLFVDAPPRWRDALRYPLETPGKRVRPILTLATWEALTGRDHTESDGVMSAAIALELVHTYSLVHDDLPAMDDDDERRGRPTVHRAFDEATAILVGDALLTEAFAVIARADLDGEARLWLVRDLARAAGSAGMIGGQVLDIGMLGPIRDEDALVHLHRLKTGALLEASVTAGAYAASIGPEAPIHLPLRRYASAIGLAFQLADDLLDAEQDAGEDGPPSFVRLLGIDGTRERAEALAAEARSAIREAVGDRGEALCALAEYIVRRET